MTYIGIAYTGNDDHFLPSFVDKHSQWLSGDRKPHFYGPNFIVLYDSNTTRELIKKIVRVASNDIIVYQMEKINDKNPGEM